MKLNRKAIWLIFMTIFTFEGCDEKNAQSEIDLNNSVVIDVRTKKEFDRGHLKNAVNIPHTEIKEKIKSHVVDKNRKVVVYCRSGRRSGIAKDILDEMGYRNVINGGGYKKLKKIEK